MIKEKLAGLEPGYLEVIDDSAAHAGHPGAIQSGGGHFTVIIQSSSFADQSLVKCHQLVYQSLGNMMESEIHALSIQIKR